MIDRSIDFSADAVASPAVTMVPNPPPTIASCSVPPLMGILSFSFVLFLQRLE
jgi:hypothetical protein